MGFCSRCRCVRAASSSPDPSRTLSRPRLTILTQIGIVGHLPIINETPRHRGKHPALTVAIVGGHAGMGPNQLLVFLVDLSNIAIMRLWRNVNGSDAVFDHLDEARGDVTALAFGLKDHAAAMRWTGIGTKHAEEIRKIGYRQAEISGWIVVCPDIPQVLAVASADIETRCHFRHFESGRNHDDIRGPQFAIARNDAI